MTVVIISVLSRPFKKDAKATMRQVVRRAILRGMRLRSLRSLARAAVVAGLAGAAACSSPPAPDVLLLTVDTLRPDALGWVASRNSTPALDQIAASGVAFAGAISPVPITLPSHTAMLSGRLPRAAGVRDNGDVVPADVPLLAERLRDAGYDTGAVISGFPLRRLFGLDRGFRSYDDELPRAPSGEWGNRPADAVVRAAVRWLDERPDPRARPWFLWLHFYDPHDPYEPPARLGGATPRAAYDGEVRFVDEAIGELLSALEARFSRRPRLTLFASDHGESLGEHDEETHGFFVYDSTIRVPLVVALPGAFAPARSSLPARLVDVAPTVLDLVGAPPISSIEGRSLRPLLEGEVDSWDAAYVESWQPFLGYGWAPLRALRTATAKYVEAPRPELFDLVADPHESANVVTSRPELARRLRAELAAVERVAERPRSAGDGADEGIAAQLAALGYLGRAAEMSSVSTESLPDPKDRADLRRALVEAEKTVSRGDREAALRKFDAVLRIEPDNRYALLRAGVLRLEAGQPGAAVPFLARLAALDPRQAEAHYRLAAACLESGDARCAEVALERLVELQPRRAVAWSHLSVARWRLGDRDGALEAARRAADLEPGDPRLAANLRRLEAATPR